MSLQIIEFEEVRMDDLSDNILEAAVAGVVG
jgi:hypothetical protein